MGIVGIFFGPRGFPLELLGLVGVVGRRHGPGLLFSGDRDEGAFGNRPITPAFVADLLGELVEAQGFVEGRSRLADDRAQLLIRVLLFILEALDSSALSIPKGAPIEGIRIWVNVWIIMKSPPFIPQASSDYKAVYWGQVLQFSVLPGKGVVLHRRRQFFLFASEYR